MNLQEQMSEFEAKGCVIGDNKWCPPYEMKHQNQTPIMYIHHFNPSMDLTVMYRDNMFSGRFKNDTFYLTSVTLEEALSEALEIVKSKVVDLAKGLNLLDTNGKFVVEMIPKDTILYLVKELGYFCLTNEEHQIAVDNLKIAFDRNWKNDEEHIKTAHHIQDAYFILLGRYQEKMNQIQEFKQWVDEQNNDK